MYSKKRFAQEIENLTHQIKTKYKPEKIILYGSCTSSKIKPSSDIDMLIIKASRKRRIDRIKEVLFAVDNTLPFEPLVYTPSEIKKRLNLGDFFIQDIVKKGKVLYEKKRNSR